MLTPRVLQWLCTWNGFSLAYVRMFTFFKGNIRVFCRVRPVIKEDGASPHTVLSAHPDDEDVLMVENSKGRSQSFEMDRLFTPSVSQQQVSQHSILALFCDCRLWPFKQFVVKQFRHFINVSVFSKYRKTIETSLKNSWFLSLWNF